MRAGFPTNIATAGSIAAGSTQQGEREMIDALAESLWEAQRGGVVPDERACLEKLRKL